MRLLLDTHVFLWYINDDARLPDAFREAIRNPGNQVYLSVVSIWEAQIKYQIGKLPLPEAPAVYLPKRRTVHQIESLALGEAAVQHLAALPPHHRDPFDRMLVAQALERDLTLATVDDAVRSYTAKFLSLD